MDTVMLWGGVAATAFVLALSGALMPGPLLAVTIREAARRGAAAGPLLILGHALLEATVVGALVAGLGGILRHPAAIGSVSLAGGVMMGWMGWGMLRSARGLTLTLTAAADEPRMHPVLAGIVVSLSNPYWTLWWVTIGLGYLMSTVRLGWPGLVAFFVGHIAADALWYTAVSVGVAGGRRWLGDGGYRALIRACGVFLLVFGVRFLWKGIAEARALLAG